MRRKLVLVAVLALVVAVAAGCGGGKKKSSAPPTTAAGATTTAAATTAATTTTAAAAPKFTSTKNCAQLMALGAKVSQALQSSSGSASSRVDNEVNAFKALASAAPSEIRGDFQTFATAFAAYAQALAKAGFKPGKVPTAAQIAAMTTAAKSFSTPKLAAAEQHLSAWAQQNCGVPKTTTG
jgi:hypothetical protein